MSRGQRRQVQCLHVNALCRYNSFKQYNVNGRKTDNAPELSGPVGVGMRGFFQTREALPKNS